MSTVGIRDATGASATHRLEWRRVSALGGKEVCPNDGRRSERHKTNPCDGSYGKGERNLPRLLILLKRGRSVRAPVRIRSIERVEALRDLGISAALGRCGLPGGPVSGSPRNRVDFAHLVNVVAFARLWPLCFLRSQAVCNQSLCGKATRCNQLRSRFVRRIANRRPPLPLMVVYL
jgi:hypothetical protein